MGRVRVAGFTLSIDGYGAGPEQSLENPLGRRGKELHRWFFGTKTFRAMIGKADGSDGIDEDYAHRSMDGFGAFILGRNMFGPVRGEWPDESWKGWWGDNPPYHAPTFVLTGSFPSILAIRRSSMSGFLADNAALSEHDVGQPRFPGKRPATSPHACRPPG